MADTGQRAEREPGTSRASTIADGFPPFWLSDDLVSCGGNDEGNSCGQEEHLLIPSELQPDITRDHVNAWLVSLRLT